MTDKELILKAIEARELAYAPYSDHRVGAALVGKSGKIYLGCNGVFRASRISYSNTALILGQGSVKILPELSKAAG